MGLEDLFGVESTGPEREMGRGGDPDRSCIHGNIGAQVMADGIPPGSVTVVQVLNVVTCTTSPSPLGKVAVSARFTNRPAEAGPQNNKTRRLAI